MYHDYVLIKGAGELASGVACTLFGAGYRVLLTEIEQPTCVRRKVSFAAAIYDGEITIAGVTGQKADRWEDALSLIYNDKIAVMIDPWQQVKGRFIPTVFIDAILAKKNTGTEIQDGELVIALGPGFEAGQDAHVVIETKRGASLGRKIYSGQAMENTGIPGEIRGYTSERVIRAAAAGTFRALLEIGDYVDRGDLVGFINNQEVKASISGVIRGLLYSGLEVSPGAKLGDIHPEKNQLVCSRVTDKALIIGRSVLQVIENSQ